MKKYIYLIVLALILGLVLTGCSLLSNIGQAPATTDQSGITYLTKGGPTSFPLYAGQHDLVGNVLVWDDGETLCVTYQLSPEALAEGWLLYETHLAVATSLVGIPTNKSGNPKVGQFPFGNDELGGVAEDGPYCIDFGDEEGELDVACGDTLVIAAHAVISDASICEANGVMYATRISGGTKGLYEVDVVNGTSTLLKAMTGTGADVNNVTGYTNGLAYDPFNHMLYFTAPYSVDATTSPLYSYDIASETLTYLFTIQGPVVGASFYDGAYYYMVEKTNQLMKVEVNSGNDVTVACFDFGTASVFTFGDFAISSAGMLYGSTRVNKMFFSLDMDTCTYNEFADSNALDLQLAYGSDGKLYGINHALGTSYEINVGTGMAIPISFNFVGDADMASGELCVPNTETAWGAKKLGEIEIVEGKSWGTYFTYQINCEEN